MALHMIQKILATWWGALAVAFAMAYYIFWVVSASLNLVFHSRSLADAGAAGVLFFLMIYDRRVPLDRRAATRRKAALVAIGWGVMMYFIS